MAIRLEHLEEANAILLDGSIDISVAADLKKNLLDAIKESRPVQLVLSPSTELDITAVQLLWAAEREARSLNLSFTLKGSVPDSVVSALKEAGFEKFPVPV